MKTRTQKEKEPGKQTLLQKNYNRREKYGNETNIQKFLKQTRTLEQKTIYGEGKIQQMSDNGDGLVVPSGREGRIICKKNLLQSLNLQFYRQFLYFSLQFKVPRINGNLLNLESNFNIDLYLIENAVRSRFIIIFTQQHFLQLNNYTHNINWNFKLQV